MKEGVDISDSDSDETVVEGSVTESDLDEEELHMKRLSFVNKDISLTTETIFADEIRRVNGVLENLSPEIQLVCKLSDNLENMKQKNQINPLAHKRSETEQSQSLLQGAVFTTKISQPGLPLNASVGREQNYTVEKAEKLNKCNSVTVNLKNIILFTTIIGLDDDMSGFLKTERKISHRLTDEDDSPERSLLSSAVVKETLMAPKEWTSENVFPGVLKDCQSATMTITELDTRVKDNSLEKFTPDFILSSTSEKISRETLTEQSIMADEFEIRDLLKPLSDSESPEMINPLQDTLQCQGDALSVDISVDENSNVLPLELLTALNSFSESVVQPLCQLVGKEREVNAEEEHLRSEPSIFQIDDCTQITINNFEPQFSVKQLEEIKALTEAAFQGTLDEQLVGNQKNQDLIISDYCNVASYDKQAGEGNSSSIENISDVEATKATSYTLRKSTRIRENCTRKHIHEVSSCYKMLEETQQRIYSNDEETGNKLSSKDFGRTQDSACKDSKEQCSEPEASTYQASTMNVNSKVEQMRKSQRLAKKITKQTSVKNFSNTAPVASIPLSKICRKNLFGETLLHKAVAEDDTDLVHKIIKVGANVNTQDYAGWTPLHEASVEGFYKTANELLKAGADVNCKGSEQVTPIQDAVKEGHYEVAELLLWYGADPLFKNEKGRCAFDEATDQRMKKLLESYITKSRRGSTSELARYRGPQGANDQRVSLDLVAPSSQGVGQRGVFLHLSRSGIVESRGPVFEGHCDIHHDDLVPVLVGDDDVRSQLAGATQIGGDILIGGGPGDSPLDGILQSTLRDVPHRGVWAHQKVEAMSDHGNVAQITHSRDAAKKDVESTLNAQRINDTNQHQLEVHSDSPVHNSDVGNNNTSKQGFINFEQSSKDNSIRNSKGSISRVFEDHRLLNEKNSKDRRLVPTQTKKSAGTVEKIVSIENISEYRTIVFPSDTSRDKTRSRSHKTYDPHVGHNNTGFTVNTSSSKRITRSSVHRNDSSDNICEVGGKPSIPKQTEMQKEYDFCNSDTPVSEEREKTCGSNNKPSIIMTDQVISLPCTESSIPLVKASTEQSENVELTEPDSHSVLSLCEEIIVPLVTAEQCFMNQDNEHHYLNHNKDGSMGDKNLNTTKRKSSIHFVEENMIYTENNRPSDQFLYSENFRDQINFDIDRDRINDEEQSLKHSLPLFEDISLQGNWLESGSVTTFSPKGTVNLTDSDSTVLSEQYIENENQNIYKNISKDVDKCTVQTLQTSTEILSLHEFSAAVNRASDSESPENFSISVLMPFAHQTDDRMRMMLSAEESTGRCCTEKIEDEMNSEINTSTALQLHEKEAFRVKRKRQDLQEIILDTDLYSTSCMNKNSLHPSQLTQETEQETSQKSGEKAGIKKRNAKGESRLHLAAKKGDLSLVKTLIASGLCVNLKDNAGWTAIHEASNRGFTEVILELLKAGADVNSKSLDGTLPIHDAVSGNYFKAVNILLHHGANPNEKDKYGKNALDEACNDKMKELLKSYGATESEVAYETTEHESIIATLQDIEKKQEKLSLFEVRNPKDEGLYIHGLSQIQDTLNEVLAKQKAERDVLAKKYRASVESFKQGALREQLVKLASRQKSLLVVAQKQKELGQKIKNYRKAKQVYSRCSKKQIPNSIISHEKDNRDDLTVDEIVHRDVVTVSIDPGAKLTNGNLVETLLPVEGKFSDQEYSQHPNSCLDETGANEEASTSKEVSSHALTYENKVREYTCDKTSKSTDTIEMGTSPSEPVICITPTKCSQQEKNNYIAIAKQGSKSPNPRPVTSMLNISEAKSFVINNNIHQPIAECQQVLAGKTLQRCGHRNKASQTQPIVVSESAEISPITLQQNIFENNRTSCNVTDLVSYVPYPVHINQNSSSQYSDNQDSEQQQLNRRGNRRKKNQLKDLLELGKIKPGENVLEFKLQDFSHKVTLLGDGKIRTSDNRTYGNPVQWVKALLGNHISVSWKYVWNKVTYLGTELSKILLEEACIPNEPELPVQQKQPSESSLQSDSLKNSRSFLQLNEIVLINNEELLPCHIMDQHWKFYVECENFGF
ncbi:ankyrin repeat domain-containing protein 31 [Lepidochelys kempii]|uniref:ankyrin repeat domain-containing protein 31 n=1 Tax=Lepidochelys kempii TaxID=8472 RepID=UPI003C6F7476